MTYEQLEEKIRVWAKDQAKVRALVVIGSRAREDHAADAWADLDLILFVTDQQIFARDSSWLDSFGRVVLKALQETGAGDPEWLVLYDDGLKADIVLAAAKKPLSKALFGARFGLVSRRGVRILVGNKDKRAYDASVEPASLGKVQAAEFEAAVHLFGVTAYRAATMIRRGDLWRARQLMDVDLRRQLMQLLAWHAQAKSGSEIDTWYDGRFMGEWADPRAQAVLPGLFEPYEPAATAKALREILRLYGWLAEETAVQLQHPYPTAPIDRVHNWIESILMDIRENIELPR